MFARRQSAVSAAALLFVLAVAAVSCPLRAQDTARRVPWPSADQPAYPVSPYHGMVDGNGRIIPCRCRFQGQEFAVGEEVCMSTHLGVLMTRCDLMQNNTSWVPTNTPCTISRAPSPAGGGASHFAQAQF